MSAHFCPDKDRSFCSGHTINQWGTFLLSEVALHHCNRDNKRRGKKNHKKCNVLFRFNIWKHRETTIPCIYRAAQRSWVWVLSALYPTNFLTEGKLQSSLCTKMEHPSRFFSLLQLTQFSPSRWVIYINLIYWSHKSCHHRGNRLRKWSKAERRAKSTGRESDMNTTNIGFLLWFRFCH